MAFVCYLRDDLEMDDAMFEFRRGDQYTVTIDIGYDDETLTNYQLFTTLFRPAGSAPGEYEQMFMLVESEVSDEDPGIRNEYEIMSGLASKRLIPKPQHRAQIIRALHRATEILIGQVKPGVVSAMTVEENLPDKALRKYDQLMAVYRAQGYDARRGDSYHGVNTWMACRS